MLFQKLHLQDSREISHTRSEHKNVYENFTLGNLTWMRNEKEEIFLNCKCSTIITKPRFSCSKNFFKFSIISSPTPNHSIVVFIIFFVFHFPSKTLLIHIFEGKIFLPSRNKQEGKYTTITAIIATILVKLH